MNRILVVLLLTILASACESSGGGASTSTKFQLLGQGGSTYLVLIEPATSTDRSGIRSVADELCGGKDFCQIWFWDDVNKAAKTAPLTDAQDQAIVAVYQHNSSTGYDNLAICSAGEC